MFLQIGRKNEISLVKVLSFSMVLLIYISGDFVTCILHMFSLLCFIWGFFIENLLCGQGGMLSI